MRQKYDQWRTGFSKWINFVDWMRMQSRLHTSIHWVLNTLKMARLEQHREMPDSEGDSCNSGSGRGGSEGQEGGGGWSRAGVRGHGGVGETRDGEVAELEEVSTALQQFRSGGEGGSSWRGSKFNCEYNSTMHTDNNISHHAAFIRESVDSLCRDDADMPMPPYIRKAYITTPTLHLLVFLGS